MAHSVLGRFFSVKALLRVFVTALALSAGFAQAQSTLTHSGPYDNTGNSLGGMWVGGGGGN